MLTLIRPLTEAAEPQEIEALFSTGRPVHADGTPPHASEDGSDSSNVVIGLVGVGEIVHSDRGQLTGLDERGVESDPELVSDRGSEDGGRLIDPSVVEQLLGSEIGRFDVLTSLMSNKDDEKPLELTGRGEEAIGP